jgi:peptidoglycan hydrolase-like protein with peptidoglycan-binding domain
MDLGTDGADGVFGRATQTAVALFQRRAGLPPTGSVDEPTRAALDASAGRIRASVGAGGRNDPVDVRVVQHRLAALGFYNGRIDGISGPRLERAIRLFDGVVRGLPSFETGPAAARAAATLEPGELVERWLRAANAPRWERIPASGPGFRNVDNERHDFAASWLVDAIRAAGARYEREYRAAHPGALEIQTNDASLRAGGDTPDHESHETGLDLDLRLGRRPGVTFRSAEYDREMIWAQIRAFLDTPNVSSVIFNDPEIVRRADADPRYRGRVLTDTTGVHDNHVHVDLAPPPIVEQ